MIELVAGIIAGIGVDSAITLWAVRSMRKNQSEIADLALAKLSDGIEAMAPAIIRSIMDSEKS